MDPLVPSSLLNTFVTYTMALKAADASKIIIIIICIILGAFFAAAETALSQCNRFKIAARAEAGNKKAKVAMRILNKFDNFIVNILICINVVHIVPSSLATILLVSLMPNNSDVASLISTIGMTLIIFFFSETLPKAIANVMSDKMAEDVAIPIYFIGIILTPISLIFRFFVFFTKKIFRVKDTENQITEDDFQDTIEDIEEEGKIDAEESDLIQAAVDFGDYTVMDVMTPKEKMVCYDAKKSSRRDVLNFLENVEYSRVPVYAGDVNNIVGILHVRKYLLAVKKSRSYYFNFLSILTQPIFVNEKTKIDDMVDLFQNAHTHIAIVKNSADNSVLGMVTMEDAIEKLVGDIDEKNPPKVKLQGGNK